MAKTILIVDDEEVQLRLLETTVARQGYETLTVTSGAEALHMLEGRTPASIDLVLLDISMPEMTGIEVLQKLRPLRPSLPVIVLTAHSSISNVVEAMRAGATDFIVKPASAERIRSAVANALEQNGMVGELEPMVESLSEDLGFEDLVGSSPAMLEVVDIAKKAATSNIPVLIEGESGVGKELFARAIQQASDRRDKPFITVNCGAIPENLVESILFGHEKGAFTGAAEKHTGKFVEADGGTLFLDEIGELPFDTQVKLLRALQEGEIEPVGARSTIKVDIRLISATNRDMADRVASGKFREDLYYRLNVFPLNIPSLRKRREDIPALVKHFIARVAKTEGLDNKDVSQDTLTLLVNHNWPGNIRQLQNAIFRAVILSDDNELRPSDFPQILSHAQRRAAEVLSNPGDILKSGAFGGGMENVIAAPADAGLLTFIDDEGEVKQLRAIEAEMIALAIKKYNGRMSEVARRLGIGRSTLYRKLEEYDLDSSGKTDNYKIIA